MMNHIDQTGFVNQKEAMKRSLLTMMGKVGIVGVLELLSEVAEETAESFCDHPAPSVGAAGKSNTFYVSFWLLAATHTKELSEKLLHECSIDEG